MGSLLEINDTLQISTEQGFPAHIFDLEKHRAQPITLADVKDEVFTFDNKRRPRFFHLDPVRVYYFHNIDGRWLAWGHIVIQQQGIRKDPNWVPPEDASANVSYPDQWLTHGTYKILRVYDPEYQEMFTRRDLPEKLSYFGKPG